MAKLAKAFETYHEAVAVLERKGYVATGDRRFPWQIAETNQAACIHYTTDCKWRPVEQQAPRPLIRR